MGITKKTKFNEIMKYPKAVEYLMEKGLHCFGCPFAQVESLEQGCKGHGVNMNEIVKELNNIIKKQKKKK